MSDKNTNNHSTSSITHREIEVLLAAYVANELAAFEHVSVTQHVAQCEACQQSVAEIQHIRTLLKSLASPVPLSSTGDTTTSKYSSLADAVLAELKEESPITAKGEADTSATNSSPSSSFNNPLPRPLSGATSVIKENTAFTEKSSEAKGKKRRERQMHMKNKAFTVHEKQSLQQTIGMIAAVVFLVILVGSTIVVLNLANRSKQVAKTANSSSTTVPRKPSPTVHTTPTTPAAPHPGQVIYNHENQSSVISLAWSPNSGRIVSTDGSTVQLWDATTGKHLLTYNVSGSSVTTSVVWSPNGKYIAVASTHVQVLNASTGQPVITYPTQSQPTAIAPSIPRSTSSLSNGDTKGVHTEVLSSKSRYIPSSMFSAMTAVAWSPDSTYIASAFYDGTNRKALIQVWNASTGRTLTTYSGDVSSLVSALAWSPDGKYIATTHHLQNNTVRVWNATTGQTRLVYSVNTYTNGSVFDLGWSPDGKYIAVSEDKGEVNGKEISNVQVWDSTTGKTLSTYSDTWLTYLTWAPDGKRIAVASDTKVQVLEPTTGKIIFTYTANSAGVLKWSPNGKYIASASNTSVQVWLAP